MAITPLTGFKAFTFDGEKSTDYGVQILGEGVFNAPEREVEMINIPGRNGAFALDKGRFENIEVTYPANIIADSTADFAAAVSDLRNMLCSRRGYVRLQDDYHPDEYRMAVYKEGLEVDEKVLRAAEFDIVFDCKPQRFLTSGEEAIDVDSGDTITNPTLFESSPMLEVEGYGAIAFNGYEIELADTTLGVIELGTFPATATEFVFDENKVNVGDALFFSGITLPDARVSILRNGTDVNLTDVVGWGTTNCTAGFYAYFPYSCIMTSDPDVSAGFIVGTPSAISWQAKCKLTYEKAGTNYTYYVTIDASLSYDGSNKITFNYEITADANSDILVRFGGGNDRTLSADSTVDALGHPTYIDCDLGEVYMIKNGSVVSLNQYVDLGSDLPKLISGANAITADNTVTDLKVIPRWWKI